MKISTAKLAELVAAGVKKNQPVIDAAVSKAVAGVRAHGATGRAIAKLNNPPTDTAAVQKAADQAANARALLLRGRTPVPTKDELQAAVGSAMPFKALGDTDQTLAIMRATRAKR